MDRDARLIASLTNPISLLVEIRRLSAERWRDYRALRLEALKSDSPAFGSSFEEEEMFTEDEWKRRIQNALFAMSSDAPVGMVVYAFNGRSKTRHIAEIFGVYVSADHRGEGVGTRMLEHALLQIRKNRRVVKIKLAVNPEQRAAVKLYKKAGFVVTGRAKKELKVGRRFFDMLYMEKLL
jgi:ribosomal protein S18 acetylase RimI-like enzyme